MDLFFVNIAYAGVDDFIHNVNRLILNPLIGLMFAVALVFFFYGVVEFLWNADNEEARTMGKKHMLWGIVGLFIMMSVWGILQLVLDTLDIKGINPEKGTVKLNDYNPTIPPK
ncbi:MAG: pilin [bacterium]|nr:pilin [bacterium]